MNSKDFMRFCGDKHREIAMTFPDITLHKGSKNKGWMELEFDQINVVRRQIYRLYQYNIPS